MKEKEFDQKLLAEILVYAIYNKFVDIDRYENFNIDEQEMECLTKEDIVKIANQLLSKETLTDYPELQFEKPSVFSKLDHATEQADNALEYKREILNQICLNLMDEFPSLYSIRIESIEYGIIKVTTSDKTIQNSTLIAINDEDQLKHSIQEFLDKVETKKGQSK